MSQVLVEKDRHVLYVTLNRPERRNALTFNMFSLLHDAWDAADADADVRVIVLSGAGQTFCSGMDLKAFAGISDDPDSAAAQKRLATQPHFIERAMLKSRLPRKPVIAAVEGAAMGGGLEMVLGCDIRIADPDAKLALSEVRHALYPNSGGVVRLPRQIPYAAASLLLLTGRQIDAREAHRLGLINELAPAGGCAAQAAAVAEEIAGNGPLAIEAVVRTLRETLSMSEEEAFAHEKPYANAVFATQDGKEGAIAFAQKRKPDYRRR